MKEELLPGEVIFVRVNELEKAVGLLLSIGVELTQDQQRVVSSWLLRNELREDSEGVFRRFRDRISRLGFDEVAQETTYLLSKGALMLEGEDALVEQCLRLDELDDGEFSQYIAGFVQQTPEILREYHVNSLTEFFEKIRQIGKAEVYIWNDSLEQYVLLEHLTEEQLSVLPWGGTIQIGGPNQLIENTFQIARDYRCVFGFRSLTINGVGFRLDKN